MKSEFIKWNDNLYSVGFEKIDNQHKKLIAVINKLFNSFSEGKAEEIIQEIIQELTDYTQYHFKTEEDIFEKINYPDKEKHINEHQDFVKQISIWKNKIEKDEKDVHYDLLNFLKNWLIKHIQKEDKAYEKFFKQNNIK